MSPAEWALWTTRILSCVEALIGMWKAVQAGDDEATTEAQLGVIRAMKDAQARERIGLR